MNKENKDKRQERMEDLLYVPPIVLAKYILDLEDTIDEAIEYIENCNYGTEEYKIYEIATTGVEELLDILKGSDK